jgi:dipeptidyl aminopeptidase/acylaminoacyl peptidase
MFGLNQLLIDHKVVSEERGIIWIFSPYGSPIEWSPDGTRLYFLSARTGWNKIWSVNADGLDLQQETFGECDDRDFQVLTDQSIIFVSNRRRKVEWSLWHQRRGNNPSFVFGDWGTVQAPVVSPDGKKFAFLFSTPAQPPEVYIFDRTTAAARLISKNAPATLALHVVPGRIFNFPSHDREIEGILFVPPGVDSINKAPAIVKLHGGPSMHDGLSWNSQLQFLASRGYVVLAVNYTGSVGYGKAFEEADRYRIGHEDCDDVAAAARALQALPFVDAGRIGVCGSSYGGYLTNLVIGRYPDLFAAAVSWYGIADWFTNDAFPRLHPVVKYFFRDRMGDPEARKALYQFASPVTYAESVQTPLLLAHGDADTVVPIGQSEEFYKSLLARGAKVSYSVYKGEGHGWSMHATRVDAFGRMEKWFHEHLQGQR